MKCSENHATFHEDLLKFVTIRPSPQSSQNLGSFERSQNFIFVPFLFTSYSQLNHHFCRVDPCRISIMKLFHTLKDFYKISLFSMPLQNSLKRLLKALIYKLKSDKREKCKLCNSKISLSFFCQFFRKKAAQKLSCLLMIARNL